MEWYFFALLTPLLYSITNYIEKYLIEKRIKNPLILLISSSFVSIILGFGIILFRGLPNLEWDQIVLIIFAGILLKMYLIPYLFALKLEDASRVVPLFQLVPIIVLSLAWIFLGENMTVFQVIGALVVVAGGLLLGLEKQKQSNTKFKFRKAYWYMLISSFMYASILVMVRSVVKEHSIWDFLSYEYFGAGLGGFLMLGVTSVRKSFVEEFTSIKKIFAFILVNDLLAIIAQVAETIAISLVSVAFVSIITGTQPIMLLIIGTVISLLFPSIVKEDISKQVILSKLASVLLIIVGLYLVYFW